MCVYIYICVCIYIYIHIYIYIYNAAALAATRVEHKGGRVPPNPRSLAQAPPLPLGSVPSACVLVSPLYRSQLAALSSHA